MHTSQLIRLMTLTTSLLSIALSSGMAQTGATSTAPAVATPIKHVVVIFQENVSFDHYFATYPYALNSEGGEPVFVSSRRTPNVNGLNGRC